ncbi:hypothetical protein ACFW04_013522 [Cataglyphis niger]
MKDFLTKDLPEELSIEESLKDYNDVKDKEENNFNKWSYWAKNIDDKVKILIADNEGDRENAHYMPKLADYLMKDVKLLPLWSCICQDRFGFDRVPASSASVESDFNIIKNIMLKNEKTPMRADEFVMKHVNFMSGRIKLYVHALAECSMPIGEEGYGQQRVCVDCQLINNVQDIIATKETENWRGLATADIKSKGRYLQKKVYEMNFY